LFWKTRPADGDHLSCAVRSEGTVKYILEVERRAIQAIFAIKSHGYLLEVVFPNSGVLLTQRIESFI